MVRASNDVSRLVCENTIQENERRLIEARIKSQVLRHKAKGRTKRDLGRLFHKLNQFKVKEDSAKSAEKLGLPCYNKNVTSCWYGPVPGFPSGSWWGIRMDCSRDRVHDPFDTDVDEGPFGVTSICTSHANMNEDVDLGDFLTLTGQVYHEEQANVDPFVLNYKSEIPLRLIRSYNLQDNIAPNTGYRYDGLYIVIGHWIGINGNGTKYNKFALMRHIDQEPSCWNSRASEILPSMRHCNSSTELIYLKPCISSNAYDLRKCSHSTDSISQKRKLSHRNDSDNQPTAKLTPSISIKKSIPESSILTRHVFKKPKSTENTLCSASVLDQKVLTGLGTSTSKTHSTNISIRMGLYESSHNVQEAKKSVSTMLHKPFKPIDISNRTALDIGSICLPPKEEIKPIARIDIDKTRTNPQPIESASYNEHVMTNNITLNKRRKNSCSLDTHLSKCSYVVSSSLKSPENGENTMENTVERKEQLQRSTDVSMQKLDSDKELQRNSVVTHRMRVLKRHDDTSEISTESLCLQNIKFVKSLDSLTPDKILNLINKEKHHPLSKLLIGNVIGLTSEECAMWNTSKMTTSDTLTKTNYKRDNAKENVACLSEDTLNRRYCRYSKSKRLPWKVTKQTDVGKFDKVISRQSRSNTENCNNNARIKDQNSISKESAEFLSPFHVQTPLQATAQHTRSAYDIKTRMRTKKGVVLAKQDFPGSSIKKNRYKKQDREIANLSIDANIGPKTRGPRNRRLRCINNTYTSKRYYSTFNTVMYPTGKRNRITEKQRYNTSFKRKSKLTKVSRQRARDRQANKDRYRVSNTLHTKSDSKGIESSIKKKKHFDRAVNTDKDDSNYNNEINGKKEKKANTVDHNVTKTSFDRNLQEKLAQTVPLSCHAPRMSRLHYFHKREVEKPHMMDATTQCRLIFEEPTENILEKTIGNENMQSTLFERSANQRSMIKMNWDKSGKVKSESIRNARNTCDERNLQINETSQCSPTSTFIMDEEHYTDNSGCSCKKSAEKSLKNKTSAFVPVNAFDNDLRIARLRSIGFKPIIKPRSPLVANERIASNDQQDVFMTTGNVMKRNVAEEYEKYTNNEDDNMVVYMDDKLQYEDIEREEHDEGAFGRECVTSWMKTLTKSTFRNVQSNNDTVLPKTLASCDNIESPWHGWKKIETDNRSYWIGW